MVYMRFRKCLAVLIGLALTATGLWAAGEEEGSTAAAADKKYVTDPSTGKVVTAPEYGGTVTFAQKEEPPGTDLVVSGSAGGVDGRFREAGLGGLGNDRRVKWNFQFLNVPANTKGQLAESWSQPDSLTYIFHSPPGRSLA